MKISILSGKGGTGKTTLSVNLFSYVKNAMLIDTDIEEPNAHLFLDATTTNTTPIYKNYPIVDTEKCTFCKKCGTYCNFNAIIPTNKKVLVFDDLCHDCGLCSLVCDQGAISYLPKEIGTIYHMSHNNKSYLYGKLNVGEVSGVPLINNLNHLSLEDDIVITDCPPGVSCNTVSALENSDYAIICAEPTPFGVSDMKMVVELLRAEKIPFGVVINKSGLGNNDIYNYLEKEKIKLIEEIPWTKERAVLYSEGKIMINHDNILREKIRNITTQVIGDLNDK